MIFLALPQMQRSATIKQASVDKTATWIAIKQTADPGKVPQASNRMLRSSQLLRVTGALVEIRSMPVAA